jgi:hypothetical protein
VNTINVQLAGAATPTAATMTAYDTGAPLSPGSLPAKGGLQIVLDEQLLRVTLIVDVVKLAPRN